MVTRDSYLEILKDLRHANTLIKLVTGVRRCGKSTLLRQFRDFLIEDGVSEENIISLNLEEDENKAFAQDASILHEHIIKLANPEKMNYVFLDEVQVVPGFERMLASLLVKEHLDIYVTGSNAYITSSEMATFLTGRCYEIRMQPLVFSEFVKFFPETSDRHDLFALFMKYGGFPEVANFVSARLEASVSTYLSGVYENILVKDIEQRKKFRSMEDFRNTIKFAFDNVGNTLSPTKIANVLDEAGHKVDKEMVDKYLDAMQESYVLCRTPRYDIRGKGLLKTLEKCYSIDLGLSSAVLNQKENTNLGHKLENLVYLELKKRNIQVWIGKNRDREIDFVVKTMDGDIEYYQVSQSVLDEKTFEREITPLLNTGDAYKKTILTLDYVTAGHKGIECKNVVDWLLGR